MQCGPGMEARLDPWDDTVWQDCKGSYKILAKVEQCRWATAWMQVLCLLALLAYRVASVVVAFVG